VDETNADQVITEQVSHFSSIGRSFMWRIYEHDLPRDLGTRLHNAGFTHIGTSELMIAEVGDLLAPEELPEGVSFLQADDEQLIRRLIEVHESVFRSDQSKLGGMLRAQQSVASTLNEFVVAMADGRPVASSRVQFFPDSEFAGLWGGSTLPEWRGRGLYSAMVAHRARIAAARGYNYVYVVASDESRPILEGLSFRSFGPISSFEWQPARTLQ